MNQPLTDTDFMAQSEKIFQQCLIKDFTALEVDLEELLKVLSGLVDTCMDAQGMANALLLSVQERE